MKRIFEFAIQGQKTNVRITAVSLTDEMRYEFTRRANKVAETTLKALGDAYGHLNVKRKN